MTKLEESEGSEGGKSVELVIYQVRKGKFDPSFDPGPWYR